MPYKYGCYISKKTAKRDMEFFEKQKLSIEQVKTIQNYLHKRLAIQEALTATIVVIVFITVITVPLALEVIEAFREVEAITKNNHKIGLLN